MPAFHFAPARGWMNDPNGLIHWRGRHHLFFQHDPDSVVPNDIGWGHASSTDLLHWEQHPAALRPGAGGTDYDADGCYSGCAVADGPGVTLLYTGVQGSAQLPCLAHSVDADLGRFDKDAGNPVIAAPPVDDVTAFRDHSLIRDGALWRQAVGGGTASRGGTVFGFTSPDLRAWEPDGLLLDGTRSSVPGEIWECPDLFALDDRDVLVMSILDSERHFSEATPAVWVSVGRRVGGRFDPAGEALVDYGERLYAPQSYWTADRRRIMFGWLRSDLDPASETDATSRGVMSLPRELRVCADRLLAAPAAELAALRARRADTAVARRAGSTEVRFAAGLGAFELVASRTPPHIRLADSATGDTLVVAPPEPDGDTELRLFFDGGVVETFHGGRAGSFTDLRLRTVDEVSLGDTACDVEVWLP